VRKLLIGILALTLLAGHAGASSSTSQRVSADVARLASPAWEGRRAGTRGADRAADWIAQQLKKAGASPAGERGTFFQTFSFIDGVDLGPHNHLVGHSATTHRWKIDSDYRPLAFSSPGEVSGELVFVGYGIVAPDLQRDDYAGVEVKDRIVLVLRYGPDGDDPQSRWAAFTSLRMKAAAARAKGARALLLVTGPKTTGVEDALVPLRGEASLTDAGLPAVSIKKHVADVLLERSGSTLEEAQARLGDGKAAPFAVKEARVEIKVDVSPRRSTTRNVLGLLSPPGGSDGEAIVVGAHYDHLGKGITGSLDASPGGKVHYGADDNASGVAGMLELARHFAARRQSLKRSVLFVAFGGEELGVLGSSHFVKNPTLPWSHVVAMANMDMIGRLRENTLDVHGVGTSPAWKPLVEEAGRTLALTTRLHEGGYGPSDHSPFYAAGKPVLFAFTGAHSDYHRPTDTPDRVNAAGIEKVAEFMERVLAGLTDSEAPVTFVRVAADKEAAGPTRSFRVWVGGIPDYGEEGPGVKFSGVSPGSPAEKAGVLAGDVLVRFAGKDIRNIYDYTHALSESKPGDTVTAVVKREGREVELSVTLGSRPSATH
jgi:aminopeptidase YwaD